MVVKEEVEVGLLLGLFMALLEHHEAARHVAILLDGGDEEGWRAG